jgi:hypothetical protein
MKLSVAVLLALVLTVPGARQAQAQVEATVTIGGFYDELAPYGTWVSCDYGQCWAPAAVAVGWQPYTNGQWVYTDYGWTWVSYDPWGADPFHYGTWALVGGYGWVWVPGVVWAPAWVTWSYSDAYIGWAPLPPTVAFGVAGYVGGPVVVRETNYVFVPTNQFVSTNVTSVRVAPQQNTAMLRQTKPVTRFDVSGGIVRNTAVPVATVQRASGRRIETRSVSAAKTSPRSVSSARGGQVAVVAPAAEVKAAIAAKPAAHGQNAQDRAQPRHTPSNASPRQEPRPVPPQADAGPAGHQAEPPPAPAEVRSQGEHESPAQHSSEQKPQDKKKPPAKKPEEKEKKPPEKDKDKDQNNN